MVCWMKKTQSPPIAREWEGALLQMTGALLKINIAYCGEITCRRGFTKWLSLQYRDFSSGLLDEKSNSPIFPGNGRAMVTNDRCIIEQHTAGILGGVLPIANGCPRSVEL